MTIRFVAVDGKQHRDVYTIGREPVVGEKVEVLWEETVEGVTPLKKTKGFSGVVESVYWRFGEEVRSHTVLIILE